MSQGRSIYRQLEAFSRSLPGLLLQGFCWAILAFCILRLAIPTHALSALQLLLVLSVVSIFILGPGLLLFRDRIFKRGRR